MQSEPIKRHAAGAGPHVPGSGPLQLRLQQSAPRLQPVCPSAMHGAVHTVTPLAPGAHAPTPPRQQSLSDTQIAPTGRQGPGPNAQRPEAASQTPLQQGRALALLHEAPVPRQSTRASSEWQSESSVPPSTTTAVQIGPPQAPSLQFNAQQSSACLQWAPSARHRSRHDRLAVPLSEGWPLSGPRSPPSVLRLTTGSQRPLQHAARDVQGVPGTAQLRVGMQKPPEQIDEQHSGSARQMAPLGRHTRPAGEAHVT
jgi:hypothetical protein